MVDGFRLFLSRPGLWRYAVRPILLALALMLGLLGLGLFLLTRNNLIEDLGVRVPEGAQFISRAGVGLLWVVAFFYLSGFLFVTLASMLSAFAWDRLTSDVEAAAGITPHPVPLGCGKTLTEAIGRTAFAVFMSLFALGAGCLVPVIGPLLVAGFLGVHDFTAPAFQRRGVFFGGQFREIRKLPGWGSFAIGAGAIALVPIVNVLCLPALVAGGTLMVLRGRGEAGPAARVPA